MVTDINFLAVCNQQLIAGFDEKFSESEGYSSHSSGNKELTSNEQFQVHQYSPLLCYIFTSLPLP